MPSHKKTSSKMKVKGAKLQQTNITTFCHMKTDAPLVRAPLVDVVPKVKTIDESIKKSLEYILNPQCTPCDYLEMQIKEVDETASEHDTKNEQTSLLQSKSHKQVEECNKKPVKIGKTQFKKEKKKHKKTMQIDNMKCVDTEPQLSSSIPDICLSTLKVPTSKTIINSDSDEVSDLDSEFDDEVIADPTEKTVLVGGGKSIPCNENLDEYAQGILRALETGMDSEIDHVLGSSAWFTWKDSFNTFESTAEKFSGPTPGPLKDYESPYECFTDIWDKDVIELIVRETNLYAKQSIEKMKAERTLKSASRLHHWLDTNADEIMSLFAVFMYMSLDSRAHIGEYFRAEECIEMPKFRHLMSYNRYIILLKFLHFINNSNKNRMYLQNGDESLSPKLAKLAPIIIHLNKKFSSLYNLQNNLWIDETLTIESATSRNSWLQTINLNRPTGASVGLKSYEICELQSGYLYKFQFYAGNHSHNDVDDKTASVSNLGESSITILLNLLKGLERRGHCITLDNFYNCPALARHLKSLGFDCFGPLRPTRRHVPYEIRDLPNSLSKGIIGFQSGDVSIITWKDTKWVSMISTFHKGETYITRARKYMARPVCAKDYNNAMAAVDLRNQHLSTYLSKNNYKWYMKIFRKLLNVSIHNAFVLYSSCLKRRNESPMSLRGFRYALARSIVVKHRPSLSAVGELGDRFMRLRRDAVHVPKYTTIKRDKRRCVVCLQQGKRKDVGSECITCGVHLCFHNCWTDWHSLPKLKGNKNLPCGRKGKYDDPDM